MPGATLNAVVPIRGFIPGSCSDTYKCTHKRLMDFIQTSVLMRISLEDSFDCDARVLKPVESRFCKLTQPSH